jgi:hypothetical protein
MFQRPNVEKTKTHILCSIIFFSSENRVVYEIVWKYILEPGSLQVTIWRMHIAYSISKATNTHL